MNYVTQKNMKDILDGIKGKVPMGQFVSTQTASDSPLGTIIAYMGITPPDGFLACDGSTYNIADYTALATHIMNEFGSYNYFGGDGTTTFAVPDLRGEFLRGTGTNAHSGQGNGANVGTHQDATEHPEVYAWSDNQIGVSVRNHTTNVTNNGPQKEETRPVARAGGVYVSATPFTGTGTASYTSRPTNTSVLYCIKYTAGVNTQYSTTEQVIGTWIDGSPLYQTIIQNTIPTITTDGTPASKDVDISSLNAKTIISTNGILIANDSYVPMNCTNSIANSNFSVIFGIKRDTTKAYIDTLVIRSSVSVHSNAPCYITIQYTKV